MAVYTQISDEALESLTNRFDLGSLVMVKGIAEGVENSNFLVETTRGRFVLTLYERRVKAEDLPYFMELLTHLKQQGIACAAPLHARDGRAVVEISGRPAALFPFLPGVSPKRPSATQCGTLGGALAHLHRASQGFALVRPNALSLDGWASLVAATAPRADSVYPGLAVLIAQELAFLQGGWPRGLPRGTIHADLFPDNVLFLGERINGLIDFYFACTDDYAYDVAVCLNSWCFEPDGAFNHTKGHALLSRYHADRALLPAELAALPVLCRGAALRFLLTRLYDWLHPDSQAMVRPKDPREYVMKLRFHQTALSAVDYGWHAP